MRLLQKDLGRKETKGHVVGQLEKEQRPFLLGRKVTERRNVPLESRSCCGFPAYCKCQEGVQLYVILVVQECILEREYKGSPVAWHGRQVERGRPLILQWE